MQGIVAAILIAMASAVASTDTMPVAAAPLHVAEADVARADGTLSETSAMLIAGVGVMSLIVRRRQRHDRLV